MTVRLGLDASLRIPNCAISAGGEIALVTAAGSPVEAFPTVIRQALREAGLQLGDVDEIVACVGPGSYMGARTTVATANALALAIDRPVTGILSVDAVAVLAAADTLRTVAVPAGRGRWFVAGYHWTGELLQRAGLPELVDHPEPDAFRVCEPDGDSPGELGLNARGALIVAERQGHLATEKCRSEVTPHLPPASVR